MVLLSAFRLIVKIFACSCLDYFLIVLSSGLTIIEVLYWDLGGVMNAIDSWGSVRTRIFVIFCVSVMWLYFDVNLFIMNVCDTILTGNQHTIVSIMTILRARQLRTHDSAQERARDLFSLPEPPLWLWGHPLGAWGPFPGG